MLIDKRVGFCYLSESGQRQRAYRAPCIVASAKPVLHMLVLLCAALYSGAYLWGHLDSQASVID